LDYQFSQDEEQFRERVRQLIKEHAPADFRGMFVDDISAYEFTRDFCRLLAQSGLLTLSWPAEHGGAEAGEWMQVILSEEMLAHYEPRGPQYSNVNWVGPAIVRHGTEAQKRHHLPLIARGDVIWCQGFSEPESGSDLASLRTRATKVDGGFRVSGQKIWTSYADLADYCFLAVRTSDEQRKQDGLTVFLMPMDREGIEVRPIRTLLGPHHLNELFLSEVFVKDDEILGELGQGWQTMTSGLAYERAGVQTPRYAVTSRMLSEAWQTHHETGIPPSMTSRFVSAIVHTRVAQLMSYRIIAKYADGRPPAYDANLTRIHGTTLVQEVADFVMDLGGALELLPHGVEHDWRWSQPSTVTAGTLEIQKLVVAREAL
jgi:alkylation response protein AidB-like acyl-CoA dehydrogenase